MATVNPRLARPRVEAWCRTCQRITWHNLAGHQIPSHDKPVAIGHCRTCRTWHGTVLHTDHPVQIPKGT